MSHNYRKIYTRIWDDEKFSSLSQNGKLLAAWLLTTERTNRCGFCRYSKGLASEQTKIPIERMTESVKETTEKMDWPFDPKTGIVFFPNWFRFNQPQTWKNLAGALSDLRDLPETPILGMIDRLKECLNPSFNGKFDELVLKMRGAIPPDSLHSTDSVRTPSVLGSCNGNGNCSCKECESNCEVQNGGGKNANGSHKKTGPPVFDFSSFCNSDEWNRLGWSKEACRHILCAVNFYAKLDPQMDLGSRDAKIYWKLGALGATKRIPHSIIKDAVEHTFATVGDGQSVEHPDGVENIAGLIWSAIGSRLGEYYGDPDKSFEDRRQSGTEKLQCLLDSTTLPSDYLRLLPGLMPIPQ